MNKYKIYRKDNYIVVTNDVTLETYYGHIKDVMVDKSNTNRPAYRFFNIKDFRDGTSLVISQILQEDGSEYTTEDFDTFYTQNTGNFNGGGSAPTGVQSVTGDVVDNTDPQNPVITGGGSQDLQSVLEQGNVSHDIYPEIYDGEVFMEYGGSGIYNYMADPSQATSLLFNRTAEGAIQYRFDPDKIEGVYTIATTDDITIVNTNTTTIALSSSTLDLTYPDAKIGDKVHCLSITLGGIIYEKTSTGWCQYLATITT